MPLLAAALLTIALAASEPSSPALPASLDLSKIRAAVVQHDGRWMPLDTLARDLVESITGEERLFDQDPVLVFLAWSFDPEAWQEVSQIPIRNSELKLEIELDTNRSLFSYSELVSHRKLHALVDSLQQVESGEKPNPLQAKVKQIRDRLVSLQKVLHGWALKPVPNVNDPMAAWGSVAMFMQGGSQETNELRSIWLEMREAFLGDNATSFYSASDRFVAGLELLPAAYRPTAKQIADELHYNSMQPFRVAWIIMAIGALVAAASMLVRRWWFSWLATIALLAGFGVLSYGLLLRWRIVGSLPASNMFESLLFLSWGMGAFAIVSMIFFRHRSIPLTASAMGSLALCLADMLPIDHFIRPIAPVLLDTIWMSIHVPIIMVSYSVLALAVLVAHAQVVVMAFAPGKHGWIRSIDSMHYWYVAAGSLLLFVGIATGSMWAASSWGRYWGWDPKEVWSLVAFLGYMSILHVRINEGRTSRGVHAAGILLAVAVAVLILLRMTPLEPPKVLAFGGAGAAMVFFVLAKGYLATAVKSILAFWLIIMTYVGVNYVLGTGLHSYGFGTGAIAGHVFRTGSIDLAFIVVCAVIYLAHKRFFPARGARHACAGTTDPKGRDE